MDRDADEVLDSGHECRSLFLPPAHLLLLGVLGLTMKKGGHDDRPSLPCLNAPSLCAPRDAATCHACHAATCLTATCQAPPSVACLAVPVQDLPELA